MTDPWTQTIEAQQPSAKPEWLTEEVQNSLIARKLPLTTDGMLMLWQFAKDRLAHFKECEMQYRKICAAFLVPSKTEGTTNVELGNGYQAKVQNKYNYKLDSDNDKIWAGLEKIGSLGNEGKFVAERLVSWSPNFLLTEYRQLQEDADKGSEFAKNALKEITAFMTISEAAPTLEIREPKVKK
jgi:hypothetical protein